MSLAKKVYFLSDFHLGAPTEQKSLVREKKIVHFLETIKQDAAEIFIVGDMFDFWFEYKKVVPKGFVRLLGKLAELSDNGVGLHFFAGNHDMWVKDYFQKELNMKIYFESTIIERNNKRFFISHGDGLGPGDKGYKRLKKIFKNPICQSLFGMLPPYFGIGLANYFSRKSRAQTEITEEKFLGADKEWLLLYSKEKLQSQKIDFFIFGHRHLPIDIQLEEGSQSRYVNLGDWVHYFTYAVFDGDLLELKSYNGQSEKIIRNK